MLADMPLELYQLWVQYPWTLGDILCDAKIILTEATVHAANFTIVCFTIERYLAICRPLSSWARSSTTARAKKMILTIWILSFLSALPWASVTKVIVKWKFCNNPRDLGKHTNINRDCRWFQTELAINRMRNCIDQYMRIEDLKL